MYVLPVLTLSNEKKPNELVVVDWLTPFEPVIDIVALRTPRPSDVRTRPDTVAFDEVGVPRPRNRRPMRKSHP